METFRAMGPIVKRLGLLAVVAAITIVTAGAIGRSSGDDALSDPRPHIPASDRSGSGPLVPKGGFLAGDESGRLLILDRRGALVRRVPGRVAYGGARGIALAPDGRHAFVSVETEPPRLFRIDLATGKKQRVATAISPALSPDRSRLAYLSVVRRNDIEYKAALTIQGLQTGRRRSISIGPNVPMGTPPDNVINWSPDSRRVAVYDGNWVRLANPGTGHLSDPVAPRFRQAPVFLDAKTLVVLASSPGRSPGRVRERLVAIDLRSRESRPFAELTAPPENIIRLTRRSLLVVTALHRLTLVSQAGSKSIATDITAAAASR